MRRQAINWEKMFAKNTSDKGLLYKIYEDFSKLTIRLKSRPKIFTDTSPKKIYRYEKKKAYEREPPIIVTGEKCRLKTATRYHCIPTRMV